MEEKANQKISETNQGMSYETKTIIVILCLLFITPLGLILMWVWMKWPLWIKILLTILPFLFAFLIIGFVTWILTMVFTNPDVKKQMHEQMQQQQNVQISYMPTNPLEMTPKQTTQAFYDDYLSCINNHFQNHTGNTPRQDCPYESFSVLTPQLIQQLTQHKGGDPLLCGQNTPKSILVKEELITNNQAQVITHQMYGTSGDNQVKVDLSKSENGWEITNIVCNPR